MSTYYTTPPGPPSGKPPADQELLPGPPAEEPLHFPLTSADPAHIHPFQQAILIRNLRGSGTAVFPASQEADRTPPPTPEHEQSNAMPAYAAADDDYGASEHVPGPPSGRPPADRELPPGPPAEEPVTVQMPAAQDPHRTVHHETWPQSASQANDHVPKPVGIPSGIVGHFDSADASNVPVFGHEQAKAMTTYAAAVGNDDAETWPQSASQANDHVPEPIGIPPGKVGHLDSADASNVPVLGHEQAKAMTTHAAAVGNDGATEHVLLTLDELPELRRRGQSLLGDLHHEPETPRVRDAWLGEDADGQDALSDALDTMHLQPPYCNYLGEDYAAPRTTPAEREDSKKTCDASNAEL